MKPNTFHILSSVTLLTLASCNDEKNTESTTNSRESSSSAESSTKKSVSTNETSSSEWTKITPDTLNQVLLEKQVRELFNIDGEIKKSAKFSKVYGYTISYSWQGERTYIVNGKKVSKKQLSDVVVSLGKTYGKTTPASARQKFESAYKQSTPEQLKKAIEYKAKRDVPSELEILMEGGVTAEENKRIMEIMKAKAAAGATGLQEQNTLIKPTYEKVNDSTHWNIGSEILYVLSGAKTLEIRCNASHQNEVSKNLALKTLERVRQNLKKLP